jgi:hypothetical protein
MANWITNPKGERVLALKVHGDLEGVDGYDVATIPMTREYAQQLLTQLDAVKALKMDSLAHVSFHDYTPDFWPADYDSDLTSEEGSYLSPPKFEGEDGSGEPGRTEYDRLLIAPAAGLTDGHGWVQWTCAIKHTDPPIDIETECLDERQLRAYVADEEPWQDFKESE